MLRSLLTVLVLFVLSGFIVAQEEVLQGDITSNTTLTANKTYLLTGFVRVKEGATLTIEAGTKIYGDLATTGSLIIQPGAKIMAQGTSTNPIIFTSQFTKAGATRLPTYGDWGGVIILGKAPINVAGGTTAIEGAGDTYGGIDPADNSGVFSYVRIEYPGVAISLNNEINGLTLGGVGNKTQLDHIQVSYSGDDSFEWFGGTVNAKYLIAYRGWDDDFDTDFGYSGKLQFLLGVRDPQIADQSTSNGFESDNDGSGSTNEPRTSPTWYNVTLIGPAATKTTSIHAKFGSGMHLRRSSQNKVYNALVMGWVNGLLMDGTNVVADAQAGNTFLKNSIISGTVTTDLKSTDATFQSNMPSWFTNNGSTIITENAGVKLADPFNVESPNPMPTVGSPVFSGAAIPPTDDQKFFDRSATYIGAFGYTDWTKGWSSFNITVPEKPQDILAGDITSNLTLDANTEYTLAGFVRVKEGATLTIPAGTKIYGDYNTIGTLIVQPGAKIMAQGTVDNPIIFTSQFTKTGATRVPTYGDWGGVIILGKAPINVAGGITSIEGVGDTYGGTDASDNSGVFRYVRIEYPGVAISLNNEINGLTLGGVGNKTQLDHIQVSYSGDDSFEWFGGTVNAKYLIAYRGWDDDFDTDFGYSGKLQFLLGVRDPQIADQSTSNGFESDNDGSGSTNEPRTSPTWYNVTLIGPAATKTTSIHAKFGSGMHLRRSSQNKIYNAVIMGWVNGLLMDGTNVVADAQAGNTFLKNSIISGTVTTDLKSTDAAFQSNMPSWFTNNGSTIITENAGVKLADPFNVESPNPMPTVGSPVFSGGVIPPTDDQKFFDRSATYIGAFGYTDWTKGWSSFNITVPEKPLDVLAGDISTDMTLDANHEYTLTGFVRVKEGATLTIPAGTKIYGDYNTIGTLIVQPGAKIMAQGTVDNPIIFTSQFTKTGATRVPTYGDWGGVIILGKAPINVAGGTTSIEGVGDTYGGTDAADNSGVFRYVRIEYPGVAISLNNEINGLTLGGVGNKTQLDHIQVSYSGDDSFEWFGGTVNAKYLIAYRGWDDDFDTDFGYSGKLQFLLGVRDPQIADQSTSNGFESDNDGSGSINTPRTSPTWYNVTLIGPAVTKTTSIHAKFGSGMHLRRSSQNKIYNAVIMGWVNGLLMDGTNVVADALAGNTFLKNSIISGTVSTDLKSTDATFESSMFTWFGTNSSFIFSDNSDVRLVDPFNVNNPNPFPLSNSPVYAGAATPPNDGFFDVSATFKGAFGGSENWASEWSTLNFTPVSVEEQKNNDLPKNYSLSQNYPNPFNPATTIKFDLPNAGNVKLIVYNIIGQQVTELVNGYKEAGSYTLNWNAEKLASGIYIYRLETNNTVFTKKMTLLK